MNWILAGLPSIPEIRHVLSRLVFSAVVPKHDFVWHDRDGEGDIKPPPPTLTIENAHVNRNCNASPIPVAIIGPGWALPS